MATAPGCPANNKMSELSCDNLRANLRASRPLARLSRMHEQAHTPLMCGKPHFTKEMPPKMLQLRPKRCHPYKEVVFGVENPAPGIEARGARTQTPAHDLTSNSTWGREGGHQAAECSGPPSVTMGEGACVSYRLPTPPLGNPKACPLQARARAVCGARQSIVLGPYPSGGWRLGRTYVAQLPQQCNS